SADQPREAAGGSWPPLPRALGRLAGAGLGLLRDPSRALGAASLGAAAAGTLAQITMLPPDPSTPLKGKLGVSKRAAWSEPISLGDIKAAGARDGATINDVLVAATAGALRRYLLSRGQDVNDLEIRVAVPVNLRPLDREAELGNQFGLVMLPLPIGVADG